MECLYGSDKRTTREAPKRLENRAFNEKGQRGALAFSASAGKIAGKISEPSGDVTAPSFFRAWIRLLACGKKTEKSQGARIPSGNLHRGQS